MKKTLLSLLIVFLTLPSVILAQESTGSGSVDPNLVKENIKKRIQQAVDSNPDSLTPKSPIKAWTGQVQSLTSQTITITRDDLARIVAVSAVTRVLKSDSRGVKTAAKLEDVGIGDFLIAFGRVDDNDILNAVRIVAYASAPKDLDKRALQGVVNQIKASESEISITSENVTYTLIYGKKTVYTGKDLNKTIDIDDINPGDLVIVVYTPDEGDSSILNLGRLHRLTTPPTPSPSPSPTAKPKATPKPTPNTEG